VYGRYDNDLARMERVIPLFIRKINRGEQITVYGEDKVLDFTYVDDCVQGVARGLQRLVAGEIANHTINLAYGQGNSLVDMARFIGEALGKTPNMRIEPSRIGEVTHYVANIGKARALLDYLPETPLREGIRRSVAWSLDYWSQENSVQQPR
jgi:nucleoside-diphosphate-sugar epimerase